MTNQQHTTSTTLCRSPGGPVLARGFSLIEIMVVVVIIAVLAGLVVPRMGNLGARQAESEARAVHALVASAAQRDAMSSQAYAIAFDSGASKLGLLALVEESPREGDPPVARWVPAPGQPPVQIAAGELRSVSVDGQQLSGEWKIELRPGQPRPSISVLMGVRDSPDGSAWQIDLAPGAMAAVLIALESPGQWSPMGSGVQDLDTAAGRSTPW